jgi:hypothetical protein
MIPIFLGTFFTITQNDVSSSLGYAGSLVGDFLPLLLVIVGISIGIFVVGKITHLF